MQLQYVMFFFLFVAFLIRSPPLAFDVDQVNGAYACENDKVMNDIVKRDLAFQGCEYHSLPSIIMY